MKRLISIAALIIPTTILFTGCGGTVNLTGSVRYTQPATTENATEKETETQLTSLEETESESETETVEVDIPKYSINYEGHSYYLYNSDWEGIDTYKEAAAFCEEKGGYLAEISSDDENAFLFKYVQDEGYSSAYIGYRYVIDDNEGWKNVHDSSNNYSNWGIDQPDESGENFYTKFATAAADGTWANDCFSSTTENLFICEWDVENPDSENQ
jgi:hypothetical protein